MNKQRALTKTDLILFCFYKLTKGKVTSVRYEDVVVNAYKLFPKVFNLRGYPEFPDAEMVKKKMYDRLKPKGYLRTGGGNVQLTEFGIQEAQRIESVIKGNKKPEESKITKEEQNELKRVINLKGFILYQGDTDFDPIDSDYYDFYGITVRTPKRHVAGRQAISDVMLKTAIENGMEGAVKLSDYKHLLDSIFRKE